MAQTQGQPGAFPPGFADQAAQFLQEQAEDGVERLICYDRDENVALTIRLPIADPGEAAAQYRKAWQIWRDGGSVIRLRASPPAGAPQNEYRHPIAELPDFGLEA